MVRKPMTTNIGAGTGMAPSRKNGGTSTTMAAVSTTLAMAPTTSRPPTPTEIIQHLNQRSRGSTNNNSHHRGRNSIPYYNQDDDDPDRSKVRGGREGQGGHHPGTGRSATTMGTPTPIVSNTKSSRQRSHHHHDQQRALTPVDPIISGDINNNNSTFGDDNGQQPPTKGNTSVADRRHQEQRRSRSPSMRAATTTTTATTISTSTAQRPPRQSTSTTTKTAADSVSIPLGRRFTTVVAEAGSQAASRVSRTSTNSNSSMATSGTNNTSQPSLSSSRNARPPPIRTVLSVASSSTATGLQSQSTSAASSANSSSSGAGSRIPVASSSSSEEDDAAVASALAASSSSSSSSSGTSDVISVPPVRAVVSDSGLSSLLSSSGSDNRSATSSPSQSSSSSSPPPPRNTSSNPAAERPKGGIPKQGKKSRKNDSGDHDDDSVGPTQSLAAGCNQVLKLLEQITIKDAPPCNEYVGSTLTTTTTPTAAVAPGATRHRRSGSTGTTHHSLPWSLHALHNQPQQQHLQNQHPLATPKSNITMATGTLTGAPQDASIGHSLSTSSGTFAVIRHEHGTLLMSMSQKTSPNSCSHTTTEGDEDDNEQNAIHDDNGDNEDATHDATTRTAVSRRSSVMTEEASSTLEDVTSPHPSTAAETAATMATTVATSIRSPQASNSLLAEGKTTCSTLPTTSKSNKNDQSQTDNPLVRHYQHHANQYTNVKLGHAPLAALCSWTVEQVQGILEYCQNDETSATVKSFHVPRLLSLDVTAQQHQQLQQRRHILTSRDDDEGRRCKLPLPNLTKTPMLANAARLDSIGATEETQREEPRLQMFGSEYARHLSTCQLAPKRTTALTSASKGGRRGLWSPPSQHPQQQPHVVPIASRLGTGGSLNANVAPLLLEAAHPRIVTGALLDLCVTAGDDRPPRGYYRIHLTATGFPMHGNNSNNTTLLSVSSLTSNKSKYHHSSSSSSSSFYYVNVKKESNWDKAAQRPCITALAIIFPDRKEFVPPGFCIARLHRNTTNSNKKLGSKASAAQDKNGQNIPADLNAGGCERIYLCFRRSREGNPITGLVPLRPDLGERVPEGYTVLEQSPRNHLAVCGNVFWAFRQRLASLECLRPLPLVLTVHRHHQAPTDSKTATSKKNTNSPLPRLAAYYATGGTTVSADVGHFHILDRSTHSLLSPSSIANRLQLIEMSRQRSAAATTASTTMASTFADTDEEGKHTSGGADSACDADSVHDSASLSYNEDGRESPSVSSSVPAAGVVAEDVWEAPELRPATTENTNPNAQPIHDNNHSSQQQDTDNMLQRSLAALEFIPEIDTAQRGQDNIGATLRLEARSALLAPLLTACYTRHGGAALTSVQGLTDLLTQADFFADDVPSPDDDDDNIDDVDDNITQKEPTTTDSRHLTLLDLTIQVVCDVATNSAQETLFGSCVDFVEQAVRLAQGSLHTRTIGYVVRFYLFVFYFGASIPAAGKTSWPHPSWRSHELFNDDSDPHRSADDDCSVLSDPRVASTRNGISSSRGYLPGGAPQAAALAFKDLISLSVLRLGKVSITNFHALAQSAMAEQLAIQQANMLDPYGPFLERLLNSVVKDSVDHVERANYTQLALHQVHRSGGSELFWYDMVNACGVGMFGREKKLTAAGKQVYIVIFAMLTFLVKVSSGKLRTSAKTAELMPRDNASKLLSLELLLHFLEDLSDGYEAVHGLSMRATVEGHKLTETLAFCVRRTVVPCLFWNTRAALENPQVYKRIIRIVSELWSSSVYRNACRVELGLLMEHFALRMLQFGPQLIARDRIDVGLERAPGSLMLQQVEVLREIKNWFSSDPKDVIELYLNYDTDFSNQVAGKTNLLPGSQSRIFQKLCASLSSIAEQCGDLIGAQIRQNQSMINSSSSSSNGVPSAEMLASMQTLHHHGGGLVDKTAIRESARLLRKTSIEAISQIVKCLAISAAAATGPEFMSLLLSWVPADGPIQYETSSLSCKSPRESGDRDQDSTSLQSPHMYDGASDDDDDEVARFWRSAISQDSERTQPEDSGPDREEYFETAKKKSLKKAIEYLIACNVLTPAPRDIANYLLMHRHDFDPSELGNYIGEGGVGGAETEYWAAIRQFFVRSLSFIGMNVEQGLRHFLTESCFRLPGEAQKIDRIVDAFAKCYFEDNAGDALCCPFKNQDTIYLLSFAVIMLNTDLHKTHQTSASRKSRKMTKSEFINNLRGTDQDGDISKEYLSRIYDSIETNPIAMLDDSNYDTSKTESNYRTLQSMLNNVRTADSLLRNLAVHDFRFSTIDDIGLESSGKNSVQNLTRSCVSKTWHQWHGVINTCLEIAHLDPQGMEPAVGILLYALSVTICLDMPTERSAFLSQLGRLMAFEEKRQGRWVSADSSNLREEEWYMELEQAFVDMTLERKIWALRKIHEWIQSLASALLVDVQNKVEMTNAVFEIVDGDFLLNDPARAFLRSGDLIKKSGRTGRMSEYRFYLFSDVLIYATQEGKRKYKIHEEFPLHLMKIIDWYPPSQKNRMVAFDVYHPRKSFQVVCRSADERKVWVDAIRAAIELEVERKMKVEAARLAAFTNLSNKA